MLVYINHFNARIDTKTNAIAYESTRKKSVMTKIIARFNHLLCVCVWKQ